MSFELLSQRLTEVAAQLDSKMPDLIATTVMVELSAQHKKRIFGDGLNSEGQKIGDYSQTPGYYNKDKFIRKAAFKPVGKPDKNGKVRTGNRTMFIATGYAGFRDIQGRETDHINLKFSGSLENNLQVAKVGDSAIYGTTDTNESKKFESLQERFGAFELSQSEKDFIETEIEVQAKNLFKN